MAKLVLIVLAIFAQQAFASLYSNYDLDNNLGEIKVEIRDLILYLEHVFPDNHHAITTVTWQCHRVAEAIQQVVNKLYDESNKRHENGELAFQQLWFDLQEIHTSLQQIALSTDVTDVREIKKQLILNLQLVGETLEKAMRVTFITHPEFRPILKTIFVDFLHALRDIRRTFQEEKHDVSQRTSLRRLVIEITKLSQKILFHLKEISPEKFQTFFNGIDRIVDELRMKRSVGDDEVDVVLKRIASKLGRIRYDRNFEEVVMLFEELTHFIENGSQHEMEDTFIHKIVYEYYVLVRNMSERTEQSQFYYEEAHKMMPLYTAGGRW